MLKQVARIECGNKTGSGFLVGEDLVLTALHNVADRRANPIEFTSPIQVTFPVLTLEAPDTVGIAPRT